MKNKIVSAARQALAEACWKGYKARGMKKKGNRMVPNCVKESKLDDLPTQMRLAAQEARANGKDPVEAVERVRKRFEAEADEEHYDDKDTQKKGIGESEDSLPKKPRAGQRARQRRAGVTPKEPPKPKHTRRDSIELAGTVTPNHPDYLRKKLYNRPTKGSTMPGDDAGNATEREPVKRINRRGLTNKSKARQARTKRKFAKLDKVPNLPEKPEKGSYADQEYKDIVNDGDSDFN